jgi:hypothetical protein
MVKETWWLAGALALGCVGRSENAGAADASVPGAAMTLAAPVPTPLPDAGLVMERLPQPASVVPPAPRLEFEVPPPGASSGIRAPPQSDAPPPRSPPLGPVTRPYSPTPPKLDSKGRAPVPRLDPNQPQVVIPPKGPSNENAPTQNR